MRYLRPLKALFLAGCSLAVALLLVEIGLRVAGISYPIFLDIDRDRGFGLAPGKEAWQTREGRAFIKINSDGLRDVEHTIEKPRNVIRIAVLGDSYAEALQVPLEQTFWRTLQNELSACPVVQGRKIEVINFGVSGYGTAQELLTLQHHVWKYDPDIVLLAFLTGNDITDNSLALRGNPTIPYFVYKNGALVLDKSYMTPSFRFKLDVGYDHWSPLLYDLRFIQVIKETQRVLSAWSAKAKGAQQDPNARRNVPPGLEDGLDHAIYRPPPNARWKEAWRVTEGLILEMANEVRSRKADFWIVTLTNGIQVNPDPQVRKAYMDWLGVDNLSYPDRRIAHLAERNGIPVITLVDPLAAYALKNNVYLHGFENSIGKGHWNKVGHMVAGKEIASQMCGRPSKALLPK